MRLSKYFSLLLAVVFIAQAVSSFAADSVFLCLASESFCQKDGGMIRGAARAANIGHLDVTEVYKSENGQNGDAPTVQSYTVYFGDKSIWIAGKKKSFDKKAARRNLKEPEDASISNVVFDVFDAIKWNVNTFTFFTLVDDMFGFARIEENFVALHEIVSDMPIAVWHELCEYLISTGEMKIGLSGNRLAIAVRGKSAEVILGDEAMSIAAKNTTDPHYLLWAMQRQLWPEEDRILSALIGVMQLLNEGLDGYDRYAKETVFALAKKLCFAGVLTTENVNTFANVFIPMAKSYYDSEETGLLRRYCDLVDSLVQAGIMTDKNVANIPVIIKPGNIYRTIRSSVDNFEKLFKALDISCDLFYEEANYLKMLEELSVDETALQEARFAAKGALDMRLRSFSGNRGKQGLKEQLLFLADADRKGVVINTESRKHVRIKTAFIDWHGTINNVSKFKKEAIFKKLKSLGIEINILTTGSPEDIRVSLKNEGLLGYVTLVIGVGRVATLDLEGEVSVVSGSKREYIVDYLAKQCVDGQGVLVIDNENKNFVHHGGAINIGVVNETLEDIKRYIRDDDIVDCCVNPSLPDFEILCLGDYGSFEYLMDRIVGERELSPEDRDILHAHVSALAV